MERAAAWNLLCQYTKSESLRKHALAVEACMCAYADKSGHFQAMALTKPAGHGWQQAKEVLAPTGATADPNSYLNALACPSAGNCIAVGDYRIPTSSSKPMGAVQSNGTWHRAVAIALPSNAAADLTADLRGISCRSGICTAVGDYYFAASASRALWVTEKSGHFGTGKEVITAPPNASPVADTDFYSIFCPQTGPCVAVGNYITPGQELMAIVPLRLWVTANFKETQLTHIRRGQPVSIDVDGFPDVTLKGHVDSVSPASGLEFALLPPDNATGNFTKIVQRVPVRIAIDHNPLHGRLRAGMSVEPSIDTRGSTKAS